MVFYGHKTIRTGERYAVWSMNGACKLVDGPKRITLFRQKKERLTCYTAGPDAYLVIKRRDGSTQHMPGPSSMFLHPVEHESIKVMPATEVKASEALVVIRQRQADGGKQAEHGVEMRIVKGPARFYPAADELVQHKLTEHIADREYSGSNRFHSVDLLLAHPLSLHASRCMADNSYLEIRKRDGSIEIMAGPCGTFLDPVTDDSIRLCSATTVGASEALVISRQRGERSSTALGAPVDAAADSSAVDAAVEHRIVRGPARFIPSANEWVHQKLKGALIAPPRHVPYAVCLMPCALCRVPGDVCYVPRALCAMCTMCYVLYGVLWVAVHRYDCAWAPTLTASASAEHIADENSYMEVRKRAGPIEIIHGPHSMFLDPVYDESIRVLPAKMIDASEALVVYKHSAGHEGGVMRRVVRGPARFIPASDEYLHHFEWSGVPKDGSKTTYQPKQLKFSALKVIPMTAYHNVSEVRTNDDTLITIKLMLFFDLLDIEKMLDATPDPIGDFINAASSDVIAFCSAVSYETFLNETHKLNDLGTFSQLVSRAEHIGYKMDKVVFRGFQAGAKLQAMHDDAIQERTRLRLLEETQAQEQRAMDLRLAAEQQRMAKEAELKVEQARLEAEISLSTQKAKLAEQALIDTAEQERARLQQETAVAELRAKGAVEAEIESKKLE